MESEIATVTYFDDMSSEELLSEVRRRISICAASLVNLAAAVGAAARRGLDLSPYMNPLLIDVLRKIDAGQIAPELAEKFLHCRNFHRVKSLPIDDQKRIAATGCVDVVVRRGDQFDVRRLPLDSLTKDQVQLVFGSGRIRSRSEMTAILESQSQPAGDEEFPDVQARHGIVWPDAAWRALQKRAKAEGKSEGELLLEAAKAKRIV